MLKFRWKSDQQFIVFNDSTSNKKTITLSQEKSQ